MIIGWILNPIRRYREYKQLERRWWKVKRVYDLWSRSELWKQFNDEHLALKGHLPVGPGGWCKMILGVCGPEVAPPHKHIVRDIEVMENRMRGQVEGACLCSDCTRPKPTIESVRQAMAAIGVCDDPDVVTYESEGAPSLNPYDAGETAGRIWASFHVGASKERYDVRQAAYEYTIRVFGPGAYLIGEYRKLFIDAFCAAATR